MKSLLRKGMLQEIRWKEYAVRGTLGKICYEKYVGKSML